VAGEELSSEVWLTTGTFDYSPTYGRLSLAAGRLSLVLVDAPSGKGAKWLEQTAGRRDVVATLESGEPAELFDVPISEADARVHATRTGMTVRVDGVRYKLYFYNAGRAAGRPGAATVGVVGAIPVGGAWRRALGAA
jgi:hypothetical protein